MSDSWRKARLSDVVELRRGFDLPHRDRRPGPYPVLSAGATMGSHEVAMVRGPGMVVGRATNLGEPTWSESDFWPLNTTLYAADFKGNVPRWVFHLFEVVDLKGFDSGSVQPMLNRNYVAGVEVRVPPHRDQQAIVDVLGALDDKIAADLRTTFLVQELTASMFFELVGELTPSATFEDVCEVGGGGTPKTSVPEYWDGEIPWVTPTDVTALAGPYIDTTSRTISDAGLAACSSPLYSAGSILMTSRATIGAFAVASTPMAVNQGFIVVNPRDPNLRWWIFHEMRSRVDEFVNQANGATFLELSRSKFRKLGVRLANDPVMRKFHDEAGALHAVAQIALAEARTLAKLRDTLLPQLMSGRLRVKDAEKQVEAVV